MVEIPEDELSALNTGARELEERLGGLRVMIDWVVELNRRLFEALANHPGPKAREELLQMAAEVTRMQRDCCERLRKFESQGEEIRELLRKIEELEAR